MKEKLKSNPLYFEPYIIHDMVTVYDKSTKQYIDRQRTVGISFGHTKEIVVATTICSALDSFDRRKGTMIVRNRINTALLTNFKRAKNVLHFKSITDFNLYCDRFDDTSRLLFVPYEVTRVNDNKTTRERLVDPKSRNTDVMNPSDIYLNATYIKDLHTKFFYSEKKDEQPVLCGATSNYEDSD